MKMSIKRKIVWLFLKFFGKHFGWVEVFNHYFDVEIPNTDFNVAHFVQNPAISFQKNKQIPQVLWN